MLQLPVLLEVQLQQFQLLGVELVDSGDKVEIILEIVVVVLVFDPEVHHLLEDVPQALVVKQLLVHALLLLVDLALED